VLHSYYCVHLRVFVVARDVARHGALWRRAPLPTFYGQVIGLSRSRKAGCCITEQLSPRPSQRVRNGRRCCQHLWDRPIGKQLLRFSESPLDFLRSLRWRSGNVLLRCVSPEGPAAAASQIEHSTEPLADTQDSLTAAFLEDLSQKIVQRARRGFSCGKHLGRRLCRRWRLRPDAAGALLRRSGIADIFPQNLFRPARRQLRLRIASEEFAEMAKAVVDRYPWVWYPKVGRT
jgi:hypothetical protein